MLPSRTLTDLASSLSPSLLIQGAQRIESWRSADSETELTTWFGFSVNGAWTTPYMLQAGRLARAAGVVAFDRLERAFLPQPGAWVHPEVGPRGYEVRLGVEHLHAPPLYPFAIDCPMADFQTANLPPKWLSHSLVHALIGFGHWRDLTEWQLMHMARLSEVIASLHWYWLAELGRLDHRGLAIDLNELKAADAAMYALLEEGARSSEQRANRLSEETSRIIADNGLEVLNYEIYAYRQGMYEGDLVEPDDAYLGLGEAAEYAKTHLPRLRSSAFERFLEHCMKPGRDYATSPEAFEARAARTLAALIDAPPSSEPDTVARARRTLQDLGWRLCHAAALEDKSPDADLRLVADAIAALETAAPNPDAIVAASIDALSVDGHVLALGYCPTSATAEPAKSRDARARALVTRAFAIHPALGAALEGMLPVARRVVSGPRSGSLVSQVIPHAETAAQNDEVPWLGYAYLGWLQVAEHVWSDTSSASLEKRWHYRLARRFMPEDPTTFGEYEVAWNPYLKRYPLPFDAPWNDALRKLRPGETKPFKGKHTTGVWYCYLGRGRSNPLYLPIVPRLAALISALKIPRRLDALVAHPDFGADFLREAIADEAVLLFHKPVFTRPERAIDIFEVALEAAAGLDQQVETPGPWNEPAQAEAYARFCERSGHYRESSAALCDAADIPPSGRIAELGFGTGETTREILHRLGPEGRLVAVDTAVLMHEHVLATAGLGDDPRVQFRAGSARAVNWIAAHEGGFDRIIGNACIWLTSEIGEALEQLARATVPGGRLALSVPAEYLGHVEHVSTPEAITVAAALEEARRRLGISPPTGTVAPHEALGDAGRFSALVGRAGWRDVSLTVWSRGWTAGEYLDWLAMPVVSENLCEDKARARELIEALRASVNPELPLTAAWYLITAVRA
jgi:SAM-dependent methyltransferase